MMWMINIMQTMQVEHAHHFLFRQIEMIELWGNDTDKGEESEREDKRGSEKWMKTKLKDKER